MSRELPKVAIVVPAYNCAKTVGDCIESLLAQTYPRERVHIIIVDNNSKDDTCQVVQGYPVVLERETVQTPYAARNRGISITDASIIAFTDADCVASQHWLLSMVQPFKDPAVGVTGGRIESQAPYSNLVESFLARVPVVDEAKLAPSEPKAFAGGNVAYRREALDRVGRFDAAMPGGGDVDLAWRVQAYGGYQGVYVPEAVVYHRHHSSLKGLFRQYQRYGFTEITLTTLYRDQPFHQRTPGYQLREMARQVRALGTYCLSFPIRLTRWRRWRSDRLYLAWPLLSFVRDFGHLVGRIKGLHRTRFFRQNPHKTNAQEIRRDLPIASTPISANRTTAGLSS